MSSYSGVGRSGPGELTVPWKRKNTPSPTSPLCTYDVLPRQEEAGLHHQGQVMQERPISRGREIAVDEVWKAEVNKIYHH